MKTLLIAVALAVALPVYAQNTQDAQIANVQAALAAHDEAVWQSQQHAVAKAEAKKDALDEIELENKRVDLQVKKAVARRTNDLVDATIRGMDGETQAKVNRSKQKQPQNNLYIVY